MACRLRKWEGPMRARHYDLRYLNNQGRPAPLAVGPFPFMPGQAAITGNRRARGTPESISVDNRTTEFGRRAMDAWAYQYGVRLDFIRRGRSVD
jgi:hypothetical protein